MAFATLNAYRYIHVDTNTDLYDGEWLYYPMHFLEAGYPATSLSFDHIEPGITTFPVPDHADHYYSLDVTFYEPELPGWVRKQYRVDLKNNTEDTIYIRVGPTSVPGDPGTPIGN